MPLPQATVHPTHHDVLGEHHAVGLTARGSAERLLASLPPHLSEIAEVARRDDGVVSLRWQMGECVVELDLEPDSGT